jgi:hypothetical protein
VKFPFFNVYLATWLFINKAAEIVADRKFPGLMKYDRMPFYVSIRRDAQSGVAWDTYVNSFMIGSMKP